MRLILAFALTGVAWTQIAGPIRNKISAGDLLSAESILEVHEREKGRDRGALTVNEACHTRALLAWRLVADKAIRAPVVSLAVLA